MHLINPSPGSRMKIPGLKPPSHAPLHPTIHIHTWRRAVGSMAPGLIRAEAAARMDATSKPECGWTRKPKVIILAR